MDLYLTLSVGVWAVGGVFSSAWLFWLDRERREIGFPLKAATMILWPVTLPVLLHERGDLTGWEAARNGLVWLSLLSPAVAVALVGAGTPEPPARSSGGLRSGAAHVMTTHGCFTVPPAASASVVIVAAPAENDKREAVRYWNSGIIFYQRGDYEKARDEWNRCTQLDPANSDCKTGLGRIEQSYGQTVSSPYVDRRAKFTIAN